MKKLILLSLTACLSSTSWGALIVQAEKPGVQSTTVENANTYSFDNLGAGSHSNVTYDFGGITGTYDQLYITDANAYGGANSSVYPTADYKIGGVNSYSLTLSDSVNYFGMWWSAGDQSNLLEFYLGNNKVAQYQTSTTMGTLPDTYYGNPNTGEVKSEPYAYLNFFGTDGTVFDRIVFSTTSSGPGFESDNHALLKVAAPGDGLDVSDVPEPSTYALLGSAAVVLGILRKRQAKSL